jgi:ketosteroid isomerase-like protein
VEEVTAMGGEVDRTEEARTAYQRLVEARDKAGRGEVPWSVLGEFYTDDAVFIDPGWGRFEGLPAITRFLEQSMAGLEGWTFPEEWVMVEGDRIVSFWWKRLPGTGKDGRPLQGPGVSIMRYAGEGKFDYDLDILNMTEIGELMKLSDWRPSAAMTAPPKHPHRNPTPPG